MVLINYGPDAGKIAVIVDVVDGNKCLIDGPTTGVARQVIPYKRLALTDLMVEFEKGSHSKTIEGAMTVRARAYHHHHHHHHHRPEYYYQQQQHVPWIPRRGAALRSWAAPSRRDVGDDAGRLRREAGEARGGASRRGEGRRSGETRAVPFYRRACRDEWRGRGCWGATVDCGWAAAGGTGSNTTAAG